MTRARLDNRTGYHRISPLLRTRRRTPGAGGDGAFGVPADRAIGTRRRVRVHRYFRRERRQGRRNEANPVTAAKADASILRHRSSNLRLMSANSLVRSSRRANESVRDGISRKQTLHPLRRAPRDASTPRCRDGRFGGHCKPRHQTAGATNGRSGRTSNTAAAPSTRIVMAAANGIFQLPVRSISQPNTMGEVMPASATPMMI